MKKIKLIAVDLDGTLLNPEKLLPARNRAALESAAALGIQVVPATGRFYGAIPQVVRELPFVRYVIEVNGARVTDLRRADPIARAEIPCQQALEVLCFLDELPGIFDCYIQGQGYMNAHHYQRAGEFIQDAAVLDMVRCTRKPVDNLYDHVMGGKYSPQKIQIFFRCVQDQQAGMELIRRHFPELVATTALTNNVEINCVQAQKGNALAELCRHLGVSLEETMALGDGLNDLTMIEKAGVGVAMSNGAEAVRQAADMVADNSTFEGVARAIERFCLTIQA